MRYAKDHKGETHARIVRNAAVRLREKGPAALGVAELMREVGLTHGGFYAHFDSRDALVAEAFAQAMEQSVRRWRRRAEAAPRGQEVAAIIESYLTEAHRDDVGHGCALVALGAEIARGDSRTRKVASSALSAMIEALAGRLAARPGTKARREAMALLATMAGALLLARMAGNSELSKDILDAGREAALAQAGRSRPRRARPKAADKAEAGPTATAIRPEA